MEIGDTFRVQDTETNEVFEDTVVSINPVLIYVDYTHGEDDLYYYCLVGNKFILYENDNKKIFNIRLKKSDSVKLFNKEFKLVED